MKSVEYIVTVFNTSYTEIAKKMNITTSTVTDWDRGRRPIPKEKLQLLSKLFNIAEEYLVDEKKYVKELTKAEQIKIEINYLERVGEREAFESPAVIEDLNGNLVNGYEWVNPYEGDLKDLYERLAIEELTEHVKTILNSESILKRSNFDGNDHFHIVKKLITLLEKDEMYDRLTNEDRSKEAIVNSEKVDAIDTMLIYLTEGKIQKFKNVSNFAGDLFEVLSKHNLVKEDQLDEIDDTFQGVKL